MIISILGELSSLTLTVVLITSLFVKRLKPRRKKFTIALITSVILCVFGGALYEISPEDKARMAQEAEAKKVAQAQEKEEKAQEKEAEAKEKAKEQAKKEAEEKKAQEEAQKKEEETKRKAEQEEADRIKAEEKAKKETEKAEREAQKAAEEEKKKAESDAKKKAEEEEAKRLKTEKEEREKKKGTKVEIEHYDTCTSQNRFYDRGGFHDGAFDALRVGMNPEEVTLKLSRNAKGASIEYIKDKSGNYVEVIQYHFESAWYFVDASFKGGKLYYAERNEIKASKGKKEERRILDGRE